MGAWRKNNTVVDHHVARLNNKNTIHKKKMIIHLSYITRCQCHNKNHIVSLIDKYKNDRSYKNKRLLVPVGHFKIPDFTDLLPACGNARVVHAIQGVPQVLAHDDGAVDGQLEVRQGVSDQNDDPLHPIDLLTQEDVHGMEGAHLLETFSHLVSSKPDTRT